MKWPYLISLLTIMEFCYASSGTKERKEFESKTAFDYKKINLNRFEKLFYSKLKQSSHLFKFNNQIEENYKVINRFQAFVFNDIYFDTKSHDLFKNSLSHRLRYRFSSPAKFYRFQAFPFVKTFYPHRAEIQFKYNYNSNNIVSTATESRFEFRNESLPFSIDNSAPPPPWPKQEYIYHALNGKYKNFKIAPFEDLKIILNDKKPILTQSLEMITIRNRNHIHLTSPWGSGPNPTQVFIISLDHSFNLVDKTKSFWELEVEIDRSILDKINHTLNGKYSKSTVNFTITAQNNLLSDLQIITKILQDILIKDFNLKKQEFKSKYTRMKSLK